VRVNPGDLERMREHATSCSRAAKSRLRVSKISASTARRVVETRRHDRCAHLDAVNEAKRVLHIEDEVIVSPADAANRACAPLALVASSCKPKTSLPAPSRSTRIVISAPAARICCAPTQGAPSHRHRRRVERTADVDRETAQIIYRARPNVLAEAVGFRDSKVLLMPLGELAASRRSDVVALGHPLQIG